MKDSAAVGAPLDAVGIGVGPSNLSLAALAHPVGELRLRFFEQSPEFTWYPGLLFADSVIQVSYLKDLVTLVDPTSPFSFLAFLRQRRRLYRFLTARFPQVLRREYLEYYRWASRSLPEIQFGTRVDAVTCRDQAFEVAAGGQRVRANHVVLGTGRVPDVPGCAEPHVGPTVFHAHEFLSRPRNLAAKRVALIGGGQTAGELALHLLDAPADQRCRLLWITRRGNLLPIDDSPFTNEWFMPGYSEHFFGLAASSRSRLLREQRLASDGISEALLSALYRRLYTVQCVEGDAPPVQLVPQAELTDVRPSSRGWTVTIRHRLDGATRDFEADVVILCTGYRFRVPDCLTPLEGRLALDDEGFVLRRDFSIVWDGPEHQRIYAQNAARHARGVADPNLSLLSWRGAIIVNSIAGRKVYDVEDASTCVDWAAFAAKPAAGA